MKEYQNLIGKIIIAGSIKIGSALNTIAVQIN